MLNKTLLKKHFFSVFFMICLSSMYSFSAYSGQGHDHEGHHGDEGEELLEQEKGPHGGKLFIEGDLMLELAIFEEGIPPEYRAWVTHDGEEIADAKLEVELTRLGGKVDHFTFTKTDDYWLGSGTVEEPHSFDVKITLQAEGEQHQWSFSSHEGRAEISSVIAEQAELRVALAAGGEINKTLTVYGKVMPAPGQVRQVRARFPGILTEVSVDIGDKVAKGDVLATIESNQSLNRYVLKAPLDGIITARNVSAGELAAEQVLFTVANFENLWAEFQVFPSQMQQVSEGQAIQILSAQQNVIAQSEIKHLIPDSDGEPVMIARAPLLQSDQSWSLGSLLEAKVITEKIKVPLVVRNQALQSFRDWQVVFIQVGDEYEIRPLELGKSDGEVTEVLAGLNPGDRYVVENSYLIKADLEKSGASHDH